MLIFVIMASMELQMIAGTASNQNVSHQRFVETVGELAVADIVIKNMSLDACVYNCARNNSCLALSFNLDDAVCSLSSSFSILPEAYWPGVEAPLILFKVQQVLEDFDGEKWTRFELTFQVEGVTYAKYMGKVGMHTCAKYCSTAVLLQLYDCQGFRYNVADLECEHALTGLTLASTAGLLDSASPYNYVRVDLRTDLATGKDSFLSSTFVEDLPCITASCCNSAACNGNDGYYDDSSLMAQSQHETEPWWLVDIGRVHTVYAVKFFNRLGEFGARSCNPMVKTGISLPTTLRVDDFELCHSIAGHIPAPVTLMPCISPRRARYVIFLISNIEKTPLNFLEIEVHGI